MVITIYNIESGEIVKSLIGNDDIKSQVQSGQSYIEGRFNGRNYKVIDGEPVKIDAVVDEEVDVRVIRNIELAKTDWTQLPDVPDTIKQSYTEYRQALRDITDQEGFPYNVTWPTKPEV